MHAPHLGICLARREAVMEADSPGSCTHRTRCFKPLGDCTQQRHAALKHGRQRAASNIYIYIWILIIRMYVYAEIIGAVKSLEIDFAATAVPEQWVWCRYGSLMTECCNRL